MHSMLGRVATHMCPILLCAGLLLPSGHSRQAGSTPAEIARLIQQLGSSKFADREAADRKLGAIGEPALESLREAAQRNPDAEVRRRAEALIASIEKRSYSAVRSWRAHDGS